MQLVPATTEFSIFAIVFLFGVFTTRQVNVLSGLVIVGLVVTVISDVALLSVFRESAHQSAASNPLLTFVLAIFALIVLTAALGFARHVRVLLAGGTIAFGLAVLTSDSLLFLLQQGGVIESGMYAPHGYSQRAGYVFYIGLAILTMAGLISFTAHSVRDTPADDAEDDDGDAGLSPDFAGGSRLDRKRR